MLNKLNKWMADRIGYAGRNRERGTVEIGGVLMMGMAMVFLSVGFILFPIVTDATDTLLAYSYAGNSTVTDESYTGFTSVIGITPLLVLLGFLSASVFAMFLGVRISKGQGTAKLDLGSIVLLGLSMVFIAIGLIIMPVLLDGISGIVAGDATGPMSTTYTGLSSILYVTPLLVLIAFISGTVITGFFGIKKMGS